MKELNAFRKFLAENIAPDQIVFSSRFRDENEGLEVILYVIAKSEEEATQMANQYMDENYTDSYKFERTQPLGATFGDLDPEEQKLFKGNIADFGVDTFMEGKEELNEQITPEELRKEFYKGMKIMDSALAKAKGVISQEQWNTLYAVVTKVEDAAENIGEL